MRIYAQDKKRVLKFLIEKLEFDSSSFVFCFSNTNSVSMARNEKENKERRIKKEKSKENLSQGW